MHTESKKLQIAYCILNLGALMVLYLWSNWLRCLNSGRILFGFNRKSVKYTLLLVEKMNGQVSRSKSYIFILLCFFSSDP